MLIQVQHEFVKHFLAVLIVGSIANTTSCSPQLQTKTNESNVFKRISDKRIVLSNASYRLSSAPISNAEDKPIKLEFNLSTAMDKGYLLGTKKVFEDSNVINAIEFTQFLTENNLIDRFWQAFIIREKRKKMFGGKSYEVILEDKRFGIMLQDEFQAQYLLLPIEHQARNLRSINEGYQISSSNLVTAALAVYDLEKDSCLGVEIFSSSVSFLKQNREKIIVNTCESYSRSVLTRTLIHNKSKHLLFNQ